MSDYETNQARDTPPWEQAAKQQSRLGNSSDFVQTISPLETAIHRIQQAIQHIQELTERLEDHADRVYGSETKTANKVDSEPSPPDAKLYALVYAIDQLQNRLTCLDQQVDRNTHLA